MSFNNFLVVVSAALVSFALLCMLLPIFRRWLLDQPNLRSSHSSPTPRGGGLSFLVVASFASSLALLLGPSSETFPVSLAPLFALPLATVALIDDCHSLPATWRYGVQLATALLIIYLSPLLITSTFLLLALLIAVTAVINFTNFMDGLDGLVAGCMSVVLTAVAVQLAAPWPIWALVGSLLGFLFCNWSPAKVFMGDVGSTFLGAIFAFLVLQASSWPEAFALLLVATPLLGDACLCVPRRLLAKQQVFQAHRLHLFQRLHQAGWPHARVSLTYIAATAVLAVALLVGGWPWLIGLAGVELLLGVWLDQCVAVPFAVASES